MKNIWFFTFIACSIFSCKKYEEDKFYSTYSVKNRFIKKGVWYIYEVEDLLLNKKFSPDNIERALSFDFDKSTFSLTGNGLSFDDKLTQYTQILKPSLLDKMLNQSDSIVISDGNIFELSSDKNILLLRSFVGFGSYLYPQYIQSFTVNNSIDIEFKIKKLELGYMTLSYNDRLLFRLKKRVND
jgi:hypothetical protein